MSRENIFVEYGEVQCGIVHPVHQAELFSNEYHISEF